MVVDTSALCAILFQEPEKTRMIAELASPEPKYLCSVNALEAGIVVEARWGKAGTSILAELLEASRIEVLPFDSGLSEVAMDAWRTYGKGRHPAGLNLGDCAAYSLARVLHQPLLFKGNDFGQTDVLVSPM